MDTHRYSRRTFATFSKKKKNTIENSRTKEYVNKLQQPIVGRDIMEVFFSMYPLFTDMSNVASKLAEWPHRPWNRLRPSLAENRVESTNRIRYYFGSRLMWMFERKFGWFYNWDSEPTLFGYVPYSGWKSLHEIVCCFTLHINVVKNSTALYNHCANLDVWFWGTNQISKSIPKN